MTPKHILDDLTAKALDDVDAIIKRTTALCEPGDTVATGLILTRIMKHTGLCLAVLTRVIHGANEQRAVADINMVMEMMKQAAVAQSRIVRDADGKWGPA